MFILSQCVSLRPTNAVLCVRPVTASGPRWPPSGRTSSRTRTGYARGPCTALVAPGQEAQARPPPPACAQVSFLRTVRAGFPLVGYAGVWGPRALASPCELWMPAGSSGLDRALQTLPHPLVEFILEHFCLRVPLACVEAVRTPPVHVSLWLADRHASPVAGGEPARERQVHSV